MKLLSLLSRKLLAPTVTEWDHGYKTEYVIATRYNNQDIGFNVGFSLPKNPYDADRADMFHWLNKRGVHVFQGGGSPGAVNYAKIDGVHDIETANAFLVRFLPEFDTWIRANLR